MERTLYSSKARSKDKGYYMRHEFGHSLQTFGDENTSSAKKNGPIVTARSMSRKPTVRNSLSEESIIPLPNCQHITKTTEITVTRESPAYDAQRDDMRWGAGGEAASQEQRIEDRI